MTTIRPYHPRFEADGIYHVYNRSNSQNDILFVDPANYRYFMELFRRHLNDKVSLLAFCLLPDHFHFMIRVKVTQDQSELDGENPDTLNLKKTDSIYDPVSEGFRRLFISYAKAFNKRYERRGRLFQKDFKRKHVDTNTYFETLLFYIHTNPLKHLQTLNFRTYPYSSYLDIMLDNPQYVDHSYVLSYFNGREKFDAFHEHFFKTNGYQFGDFSQKYYFLEK